MGKYVCEWKGKDKGQRGIRLEKRAKTGGLEVPLDKVHTGQRMILVVAIALRIKMKKLPGWP